MHSTVASKAAVPQPDMPNTRFLISLPSLEKQRTLKRIQLPTAWKRTAHPGKSKLFFARNG
jgi:hypothetical protein